MIFGNTLQYIATHIVQQNMQVGETQLDPVSQPDSMSMEAPTMSKTAFSMLIASTVLPKKIQEIYFGRNFATFEH